MMKNHQKKQGFAQVGIIDTIKTFLLNFQFRINNIIQTNPEVQTHQVTIAIQLFLRNYIRVQLD